MEVRLRAPIVLVHGLLGFDYLRIGPIRLKAYFPGIVEALQRAGHTIGTARLSMTRGVAARAEELRQFVQSEFPIQKVHIIAHSMGGLDARYAISRLGLENHVLSLTTIGTPHRGTTFADWAIRKFARLVKPFFRWLHISTDAFYDLTTEGCRRLNELLPDVPGIRYASVAGQWENRPLLHGYTIPSWIVRQSEGPNDGLVSVASATYGESCEVWNGDHLSLVNWASHRPKGTDGNFDRARDYVRLADQLQTWQAEHYTRRGPE